MLIKLLIVSSGIFLLCVANYHLSSFPGGWEPGGDLTMPEARMAHVIDLGLR